MTSLSEVHTLEAYVSPRRARQTIASYRIPMHITSATNLLETDALLSPLEHISISWKLTRDDFLISDVEAYECLASENGLPPIVRFPTLFDLIIHEWNGHIGSLRISINIIHAHFWKAVGSTDHDLLRRPLWTKWCVILEVSTHQPVIIFKYFFNLTCRFGVWCQLCVRYRLSTNHVAQI